MYVQNIENLCPFVNSDFQDFFGQYWARIFCSFNYEVSHNNVYFEVKHPQNYFIKIFCKLKWAQKVFADFCFDKNKGVSASSEQHAEFARLFEV